MGSKYPVLTPKEIIKALEKKGFKTVSQKGSHLKMKKKASETKTVIIPLHDEIAKGTLKSILEQADMNLYDFLSLL